MASRGTARRDILDLGGRPRHELGVFESDRKFGSLGRPEKRRFAKEFIGLVDVDNDLAAVVRQAADLHFPVDHQINAG